MYDESCSPQTKKQKTTEDQEDQATNNTTTTTNNTSHQQNNTVTFEQYPKYLMVISTDQNTSLRTMSPFILADLIDHAAHGKIANATKLANEYILLETNSPAQSKSLLESTHWGNIPVKITPHNSLNFCKGVIKTPDIKMCTDDEIVAQLYDQGVIACKRITITRDGNQIRTNTYILTFNRLQLPRVINLGYLRVQVQQYIPAPLRCTSCQKYGHHFSKCKRATPVCPKCSDSHTQAQCTVDAPLKCPNCQEDHPAYSKQCPRFKQEQDVIRLKHTLNISFPEARKRINNQTKSSYATVASKKTADAKIQTDSVFIPSSLPKPILSLPKPQPPLPSTSNSSSASTSRTQPDPKPSTSHSSKPSSSRNQPPIPPTRTSQPHNTKPSHPSKAPKPIRQSSTSQSSLNTVAATYNRFHALEDMDTSNHEDSAVEPHEPSHQTSP